MKNFTIGIILGAILVTGYFSIRGSTNFSTTEGANFFGIEKKLNLLNKDIEFYRALGSYTTLLEKPEYEKISNRFSKISEEMNKDSSKTKDLLILSFVMQAIEDKEVEEAVLKLKNKISSINKTTEDNFAKNTECAKLTTGIQDSLTKKKNANSTENFKFMFYSPTLNSCVYVTDYLYNYYSSSSYKDNYSTNTYKVYNGSTNALINEYTHYYYEYPYLDKDEANTKADDNNREFVKYILENSNYNVDLVKDFTYLF